MAVDANHPPALTGQRLPEVYDASDRSYVLGRAARHTRLVGILKIALPATALAIGSLYFFQTRLQIQVGDFKASVGKITFSPSALTMENPRLEGFTKKKGSYIVDADKAEQDLKNTSLIRLHKIRAKLKLPSNGWAHITAAKGLFDSTKEHLRMSGGISVDASSGMKALMTAAAIDIKKQLIQSDTPVTVEMAGSTIKAPHMTIMVDKRVVIFKGRVHVRLVKSPKSGKTAAAKGAAK